MKKILPENAILVPQTAKKVFSGVIFDTYQWEQKLFDGSSTIFEMLRRSDTVSTVAIVDSKLLVLKEEQPHSGTKYSFATGRVDPEDNSILSAAQREMHEETGYSFKNWRLVSVSQPHAKIEWFIYTFIAWEVLDISEPHLDAGEKNEIQLLSLKHVQQVAKEGVKYLSESYGLLGPITDVDDLLHLPELTGLKVDR